ncbi:hypothetical protein F2P81_011494 [Scophthalmus maximus]|uniref:Uncharacterized protein n=1 Tax=Scophthalmus maximus TaxID=52904 RepID=A0A6A4T1S8_SCOMX|nr:hypothetical protein F2P81_011494 [Scophthalmus maximus]
MFWMGESLQVAEESIRISGFGSAFVLFKRENVILSSLSLDSAHSHLHCPPLLWTAVLPPRIPFRTNPTLAPGPGFTCNYATLDERPTSVERIQSDQQPNSKIKYVVDFRFEHTIINLILPLCSSQQNKQSLSTNETWYYFTYKANSQGKRTVATKSACKRPFDPSFFSTVGWTLSDSLSTNETWYYFTYKANSQGKRTVATKSACKRPFDPSFFSTVGWTLSDSLFCVIVAICFSVSIMPDALPSSRYIQGNVDVCTSVNIVVQLCYGCRVRVHWVNDMIPGPPLMQCGFSIFALHFVLKLLCQ